MSSQFVEVSTSDTCDPLPSWQDGPPKQAVRQFVERATTEGSPDEIAPEDRIAVFDNDGTLWCEKPMPIQLDFILRRLVEMTNQDPSLRNRQPWLGCVRKGLRLVERSDLEALSRRRQRR